MWHTKDNIWLSHSIPLEKEVENKEEIEACWNEEEEQENIEVIKTDIGKHIVHVYMDSQCACTAQVHVVIKHWWSTLQTWKWVSSYANSTTPLAHSLPPIPCGSSGVPSSHQWPKTGTKLGTKYINTGCKVPLGNPIVIIARESIACCVVDTVH